MRKLVAYAALGLAMQYGLGMFGCNTDKSPAGSEVTETGTLVMALQATSTSGKVYRLRQAFLPVQPIAIFPPPFPEPTPVPGMGGFAGSTDAGVIGGFSGTGGSAGMGAVAGSSGGSFVFLNSEEDPTRPVIEAFLQPGTYQIELLDGWFIEQVDLLLGRSAFVPAILLSNPVQFFDIQSEQETFIQFEFEVDGERVVFDPPGRLIVGIGIQERDGTPGGLNPRRSLLETNVDAVSGFSLEQTFLAAQVNSGLVPDPVLLYQQIIDSYASAGQARLPDAVHCGDETTDGVPTLNGYPIFCDRLEHQQFDNLGLWFPTAAVNRVDLAPMDGAHCGQQRLIFANNAPIGNGRMFFIIEAQIPNPRPECGVESCRPLADFWAAQSDIDDPFTRGIRLLEAFLFGSPELLSSGFGPFISVANLSVGTGNVRTNNFNDFIWTLREFKLLSDPLGQSRAIPFPVADAPHGPLWNDLAALPAGAQCRENFLAALGGLLSDNPAEMSFIVDQACKDAESQNDFFTQVYPFHLSQGSGAFRAEIEARIAGTGLTPEDIAARAQFAGSCIGCHQEANGAFLGNGVFAPFSTGFVQVAEFTEDCGDGTPCFAASQGLTEVFLPRRLQSLVALLESPSVCGVSPDAGTVPVDGGVAPPPPPPSFDGGLAPAVDGGSAIPVPPLEPTTVLTPEETIEDLVSQEQTARDTLSGSTLGGQSARVRH